MHRYSPQLGWMVYSNGRWRKSSEGHSALQATKDFIDEVKASLEARMADGPDDFAEQLAKRIGATRTRKFINAVLALAKVDPLVCCDANLFDAQSDLLNFPNGTLELDTMMFREDDPEDFITKQTSIPFDARATCPTFDRVLAEVLPDQEVRRFLLQLLGYALTGKPLEQILVFIIGPGRTGKSLIFGIVQHLLGDYAANAEPSSFMRNSNQSIRNDLARLAGVRMALTSELGQGDILDAALVKRLSGADKITARFLHKEHFEFEPEFTLFMLSNHEPVINGADEGLARRILIVPFENVVPADNVDPHLAVKLRTEGSGIMNRLLEGLKDYQENGLCIPGSIRARTDRYLKSSDLIGQFLEHLAEGCGTSGWQAASFIHGMYVRWCNENGYKPMSSNIFGLELAARKLEKKRTNRGYSWFIPAVDTEG